MKPLKPFWRYYGAKWRAAPSYPAPLYDTIVEPFAGAAGYSLHYPHKNVILVDLYPVVAGIWRWLIGATPDEVRAIPLVDSVDDLPAWVPVGARDLIGFSMNTATTSPRRSLSAGCRALRAKGRKFYGWTEALRERVAEQVPRIKHWQIIEGDYTQVPDIEATWFIDAMYQGKAGEHYVHGSRGFDYDALAAWCLERRGQRIVCEGAGADWLPFRPHGEFKAGPRSQHSSEMIWTSLH